MMQERTAQAMEEALTQKSTDRVKQGGPGLTARVLSTTKTTTFWVVYPMFTATMKRIISADPTTKITAIINDHS